MTECREIADSLEVMLDQAMQYKSVLLQRARDFDSSVRSYEHAKVYSKLSDMPKSKVSLYKKLVETRQRLAESVEISKKREREHREHQVELQSKVDGLKAEVSKWKSRAERKADRNTEFVQRKNELTIKELEKKLEDSERWGAQETSRLKRVLEETRDEHQKVLQRHRADIVQLEDKAEQYRLEAMNAQVSLMEKSIGLQ